MKHKKTRKTIKNKRSKRNNFCKRSRRQQGGIWNTLSISKRSILEKKTPNTMNIAIVGEGPIGAIVCLYFIYYKMNFNIDNLNIFYYKSRNSFKRRHIVQINKNVLQDIEQLINLCVNCLTNNNNKQIINISIRCLEFILHKNINNKYVNIIEKPFTKNDNDESIYQHIFLCDGFSSNNRLFYIYNNISYKPLQMIFSSPILILYGNLDLSDSSITKKCINRSVVKKQYFSS